MSKHTNRNLSTQRGGEDKKGFVSAHGRNVTYPQSQCLKKGEEPDDLFFIPSILMYSSDFLMQF